MATMKRLAGVCALAFTALAAATVAASADIGRDDTAPQKLRALGRWLRSTRSRSRRGVCRRAAGAVAEMALRSSGR
jgi:hypothetical protein